MGSVEAGIENPVADRPATMATTEQSTSGFTRSATRCGAAACRCPLRVERPVAVQGRNKRSRLRTASSDQSQESDQGDPLNGVQSPIMRHSLSTSDHVRIRLGHDICRPRSLLFGRRCREPRRLPSCHVATDNMPIEIPPEHSFSASERPESNRRECRTAAEPGVRRADLRRGGGTKGEPRGYGRDKIRGHATRSVVSAFPSGYESRVACALS